jgi:hypothetical protein
VVGVVLSRVVHMPIRDIVASIAIGTLLALVIAGLTINWWLG